MNDAQTPPPENFADTDKQLFAGGPARRALDVLRASNRILVQAHDTQDMLETVCRAIVTRGHYALAWVGVAGSQGELRALAQQGEPAQAALPPARQCLAQRSSVALRNLTRDPPAWLDPAERGGLGAMLALPLRHGDVLHGVLVVGAPEESAFGDDEASLLQELAGDLAFAMEALELRRDHDRLLAVLEATPDLVAVVDPENRVRYCNRAGRQLLGEPVCDGNTPGQLYQRMPPWAREMVLTEGIPGALRDGHWQGETAILGSDGEIPVSQIIVGLGEPDGRIDHIATIMRDLRPHHRRDRQLRANEAIYRRIMHVARDGFRLIAEQFDWDGNPPARYRLPVFKGNTTLFVDIDRIRCLRADGHYTVVITSKEQHLSGQSLADLEQRLDPGQFLRTHRSYLVNMDYVAELERVDNQWFLVLMGEDKMRIPISRRNLEAVRQALGVK